MEISIESLTAHGAILMGNRHHSFSFREDRYPKGWMPKRSDRVVANGIDHVNVWLRAFGMPQHTLGFLPGTDRVFVLDLGPKAYIIEKSPTFQVNEQGLTLIDGSEGVTFLVNPQYKLVGDRDTVLRFTLNPLEVSAVALSIPPVT